MARSASRWRSQWLRHPRPGASDVGIGGTGIAGPGGGKKTNRSGTVAKAVIGGDDTRPNAAVHRRAGTGGNARSAQAGMNMKRIMMLENDKR
jgi:nicotinamide mononucleotide (NMN) deamidase PncC